MLDLPTIWAVIIAIGVMLYVVLDGFDLGIGILTIRAQDDETRNMMTATVEPVWDGNETWLIIGGGGLFAAFPTAYAILMPAFYLPLLIMLAALIFRGVAFEFRHKAVRKTTRRFWNGAFFGGSLTAAFSQGLMLGAFVQGVEVADGAFAGGALDWLSPFSLLVGVSVVVGYVLLGACWLYLKTEGELQLRARNWARLSLAAISVCFLAVSLATLSVSSQVEARWGFTMEAIDPATFFPLLPVPLSGMALCAWLWVLLSRDPAKVSFGHWLPYLLAIGIFLSGYLGLGISIFPDVVPYAVTIHEAAAHENALGLLLVGAVVMLPLILVYTGFVYSLFWGKVKPGDGYHD